MEDLHLDEMEKYHKNIYFWVLLAWVWVVYLVIWIFLDWEWLRIAGNCGLASTGLIVIAMGIHAQIKTRDYWYFKVDYRETLGLDINIRKKFTRRQLIVSSVATVLYIAFTVVALVLRFPIQYSIIAHFFGVITTAMIQINQNYILKEAIAMDDLNNLANPEYDIEDEEETDEEVSE